MSLNLLYKSMSNKYKKYKEFNKVCAYKEKYSLEERTNKSKGLLLKYPNRIPIICYTSPELPELKRSKFLVNEDMNYTSFLFSIRKNIDLNEGQALYIFIEDKLLSTNLAIKEAYDRYKSNDGFLYAYICSENTFG
jgi:GABA(A) receptor-associated protein